jgi:hypothetical protein
MIRLIIFIFCESILSIIDLIKQKLKNKKQNGKQKY